jgi:hypothetical protein
MIELYRRKRTCCMMELIHRKRTFCMMKLTIERTSCRIVVYSRNNLLRKRTATQKNLLHESNIPQREPAACYDSATKKNLLHDMQNYTMERTCCII